MSVVDVTNSLQGLGQDPKYMEKTCKPWCQDPAGSWCAWCEQSESFWVCVLLKYNWQDSEVVPNAKVDQGSDEKKREFTQVTIDKIVDSLVED